MEVRIDHELEPAEAARRLRRAAQELNLDEVADEPQGDLHGAFCKATPMGAVKAGWKVEAGHVEVRVLDKPAFLPEGMVKGMLEEGLAKALARE